VIAIRHSLLRAVSALAIVGIFIVSLQSASAESSKEAEQAGATLFRDKGCAYCHGANTQGTKKGPSLQTVRKVMKAQQITDQIKNGGQKMPSFEESLSPTEIAELVAYLRSKHRPAPSPVPASAPAVSSPTQ
jgi:mono/diheme cytochrome c family protein